MFGNKAQMQNMLKKAKKMQEELQKKQEETLNKWISAQQSKTYIHIDDTYMNCNFKFNGWKK